VAVASGDLTGPNRDAYQAVLHLFQTYGLGSLAPKIMDFIRGGYSADTVTIMLQDTPEYKTRFAANDVRVRNGLKALSPAEYLATEQSYRQIMRAAGLPPGFYDQQQDFEKYLANDVSPQELQTRVDTANKMVNQADPGTINYFKQWYSKGDMVAFALDPNRAAPLVGKAFTASQIGAQAGQHGINDLSQGTAEQLASLGVDQQSAAQGFAAISQEQPTANFLAGISGEGGFTTNDLVAETFQADQSVTQRRQKLAAQEKGRFAGSSGVGQDSLSTGKKSL